MGIPIVGLKIHVDVDVDALLVWTNLVRLVIRL